MEWCATRDSYGENVSVVPWNRTAGAPLMPLVGTLYSTVTLPSSLAFVLPSVMLQSEVVSHTVLRCRVPPGPGLEGTSRVPIRVEAGHGIARLDQSGSLCGERLGGVRKSGVSGVHFFEYRSPATSPSSVTSALSRGGTPRVRSGGLSCRYRKLG